MRAPHRPLLALAFVTLLPLSTESADAPQPSAAKLTSNVYHLADLPAIPTTVGSRRAVFDGPTATLDQVHCHVTTLNPGKSSGEPRLHRQEEIIIVKEGTVEVNFDGEKRTARAGDIIHFAANATTFLRNAGDEPATYYVIYYFTPLTPKP
jgi:quercetin dioxygenase-like cupin family protein